MRFGTPPADEQEAPELDDDQREARLELQRAYLLLSWGELDQAREACERAQDIYPDHPLAPSIAASIDIAAGKLPDALRALRRVTKKWPKAPVGHLYFAETCFLMGRGRQGWKALEKAEQLDEDGVWAEQLTAMRQTWEALEDEENLPDPIEIKEA